MNMTPCISMDSITLSKYVVLAHKRSYVYYYSNQLVGMAHGALERTIPSTNS